MRLKDLRTRVQGVCISQIGAPHPQKIICTAAGVSFVRTQRTFSRYRCRCRRNARCAVPGALLPLCCGICRRNARYAVPGGIVRAGRIARTVQTGGNADGNGGLGSMNDTAKSPPFIRWFGDWQNSGGTSLGRQSDEYGTSGFASLPTTTTPTALHATDAQYSTSSGKSQGGGIVQTGRQGVSFFNIGVLAGSGDVPDFGSPV